MAAEELCLSRYYISTFARILSSTRHHHLTRNAILSGSLKGSDDGV
jgi:hypothetical protein